MKINLTNQAKTKAINEDKKNALLSQNQITTTTTSPNDNSEQLKSFIIKFILILIGIIIFSGFIWYDSLGKDYHVKYHLIFPYGVLSS
jgi:hypothetical protein